MNASLAGDDGGATTQPAVWSFLQPRAETAPSGAPSTARSPSTTTRSDPPPADALPAARIVTPEPAGPVDVGPVGVGPIDVGPVDVGPVLGERTDPEPEASSPVLVVCADDAARAQVIDILATVGIHAVGAASGRETLRLQQHYGPSVAVVDDALGDMSAIDLQLRLQELDPHLPVVFLIEPAAAASIVQAAGELDGVLPKPVPAASLSTTVRNALSRRFLAHDYQVLLERLKRLDALEALYDPLTELPNRALLDDRLSQVLAKAQRDGTAVAVLFIDLDGFKVVNDLFGHHVGDQLLAEVGVRLAGTRRKSDTVARFGGDEFVVICPDLPTDATAGLIADKILTELARPVEVEGVEHPLTASIGIMVTEPGAAGQSADTLLRNADTAMYRAKALGRNRYEVFDQSMHDRAAERFDIEHGLRSGLAGDELLLAYQPIVDLRTGAATGLEALLRWRRPGHGTVLPATFLAVAEETGLTKPIGVWVLDRALADLTRWRRNRRLPRHFRLWVNVSPHQVASTQFVDHVEEQLTRHGVDPRQLGFEIAESSLRDQGETVAVLTELRRLGIALALDDFGAEHSNIAWLEDLPVTTLKIDPRFTRRLELPGDGRSAAVVQGLIDLGHALDITVVAEGVETRAQAQRLEAMGCDGAQGYYFGFPTVAARLWEDNRG